MIRRRPRVLLMATLFILGGCERDNPALLLPERTPLASPISRDARVVGLVGTMSGEGAWRGEDAFEGADLGVTLLNRGLSAEQAPFQLVTLDDEGDPKRAQALVRRLAESSQTVGIVYAGPPGALPAAEPVLAQAGIPAILCLGDLYGARRLSPHVFQVSPSLPWQARRIASYLVRDRGYSRIGLLHERSLMGSVASRSLADALGRLQASPPIDLAYTHVRPHLDGVLQRFRARRVEAVVVEGGPRVFLDVAEKLEAMGARYRSTARAQAFAAGEASARWGPQLVGFDLALSPLAGSASLAPGTVAAETYARGAHYLPIPALKGFRAAFKDWWSEEPVGWEQRGFDAAQLIGWAANNAGPGDDRALMLEQMNGLRFGGLDVTFGPDDHTAVDETTVGLWVVPSRAARVPERSRLPRSLPWVPLARGFSIDGKRTIVAADDWRYLFFDPPPKAAPAPRVTSARWGVRTPRSDPIH